MLTFGIVICIGYNSLHNLPATGDASGSSSTRNSESDISSSQNSSSYWSSSLSSTNSHPDEGTINGDNAGPGDNLPEGRRLWTWLILCDDGTVISLHEPHSSRTSPSPLDYRSQIAVVRKNLLTIFRSLSRAPAAIERTNAEKLKGGMGALEELPFRGHGHGELPESDPSLLFYYLFDDWYSSWSLAIERQHPYIKRLRKLVLALSVWRPFDYASC